jgi:hypothetical protein
VSRELQTRWDQMTARTGQFNGIAHRAEGNAEYWFRTVAAPVADTGNVLYEVAYSSRDVLTPRDLETRRDQLLKFISVTEP